MTFAPTRANISQAYLKLLHWGGLLLRGKSHNARIQFLRYGLVACIALAVDLGLLVVLTEFAHLHYLVSATLSFCAGLIVNYVLSVLWVFPERTVHNRFTEFSAFTLIGLLGLGLNDLLIWLLTDKVNLYYLYSKLVATAAVFFWNFFMRRYFLFMNRKVGP